MGALFAISSDNQTCKAAVDLTHRHHMHNTEATSTNDILVLCSFLYSLSISISLSSLFGIFHVIPLETKPLIQSSSQHFLPSNSLNPSHCGSAPQITFSIWLCPYEIDVRWVSAFFFLKVHVWPGIFFQSAWAPIHCWIPVVESRPRPQENSERENSLWTGGLPLFSVVMTLPTFLNSAHIVKSCWSCCIWFFFHQLIAMETSLNDLSEFLNSPHPLNADMELHHASMRHLSFFLFGGLIVQERSLSSRCWENYRWRSEVSGSKIGHADNVTLLPCLTSLF